MPALSAKFVGDSTNLNSALSGSATLATKVSGQITESLRRTSAELERQMAVAVESGGNWHGYAEQLNAVNAELRTLEQNAKKAGNAADSARYANSPSQAGSLQKQGMDADLARYNAALAENTGHLKTAKDVSADENAELVRKSEALKQEIAARRAGSVELARYYEAMRRGVVQSYHPEVMSADAAWQSKLAAFKANKAGHIPENLAGFTKVTEQAASGAGALGKFGAAAKEAAKHGGTFSGVIRENLVIIRELSRGNFTKVPGSVSILTQYLANMRGQLGVLGALFTWTGAAAALAIGGIIGGIMIFRHRLQSLTDDLSNFAAKNQEAFQVDHIAKYLSALNRIKEAQKDINESVKETTEHYNSASEAAKRELDILKEQFSHKKKMLEIEKENELAKAKTPKEKADIEAKYAGLEAANDKAERDAELEAMKKEKIALEAESKQKLKEAGEVKMKTPTGEGFMSKEADDQKTKLLESAKKDADEYKKTDAELSEEDRKKRKTSLEKDQEIIAAGTKTSFMVGQGPNGPIMQEGEDEEKAARVAAAKERVAKANGSNEGGVHTPGAEENYNTWMDQRGDRDRARKRFETLKKEAEDAAKKAAELGDDKSGKISDTAKLNAKKDADAKAEAAEKAKKALDIPDKQRGGQGFTITEHQKLGARVGGPQLALLGEAKIHTHVLKEIARNTGGRGGGGHITHTSRRGF